MSKRLNPRPSDFHSLFLRMEELISASSGADVFDEACKLVARKLFDETHNGKVLQIFEESEATALPDAIHSRCRELLEPFQLSHAGEALDALFETLMTRSSKGHKGQFFTPRYVVDFCVSLAQPAPTEVVLDPACGSGAFLNSALAFGARRVLGYDIDGRAVRVARLLLAARGGDPASIREADALRVLPEGCADVILTNPPFAGDIIDADLLATFELAKGRDRIERDVLFLERCIKALRPGGKLAIVLPHSKFAGSASRYVREWLFENADVHAVVGLGRNTFLPHTHQKANVLLAQRRTTAKNGKAGSIFFAQSERDGKNARGRLVGGHDLEEILEQYARRGQDANGNGTSLDRAALDSDLTLAPERFDRRSASSPNAIRITDLATIASAYARPQDDGAYVVLDTTHAVDGIISTRALGVAGKLQSSKKRLQAGDVIVSRLRPYLRQIAYVDRALFDRFPGAQLCCSTEFYVLRDLSAGSLAFLVPFLLGPDLQAQLARAQEGGHHPRVPAKTLAGLRVPATLVKARESLSAAFENVIAVFRSAEDARESLVAQAASASADL